MNQKYDEGFRKSLLLEYKTSDITLADMERKYGVSRSTLKDWKHRYEWEIERKDYLSIVTAEASNDIAKKSVAIMSQISESATTGLEYWVSLHDAKDDASKARIKAMPASELKILVQLIESTSNGRAISPKTVNITNNILKGMSTEDLQKARDEIEVD
jgi:transposase-like protein